ncbi:endothelin-1 [Brachionichthys hirsutus]|uniref:endothelin-1 n=1 Tax=Brachionichthys hirsutus TaxID=412623 RepID=UPI0036043421
MDIYLLICVSSVIYSGILRTVRAVPVKEPPTASTPTQGRHVRTKRCSCATFLDKECVYFCHLDIIWVNTPERVVSYGLGNAPRAKRAAADAMATRGGPRCQCFQENDSACRNFCWLETPQRRGTLPAEVTHSAGGDGCVGAQCKHKLAADAGRIKRMTNGGEERVSPLAIRSALKTRLLLEKWRLRERHRVRAWEGERAQPPKEER